ncbi:tagatose 6-phosphate kinase [Melghirimyces profundicolus]|uniref:Tagatose-6-phosphate kinase n=1 Tax=Melghirimyces profundicolus TaxID=1242148 RepID=A0A2T6C9B7_9BACL|nr:1-phosphofructokinase family hexose kinase [Melghirimyces profundicolus]PTX64909.1 tagatose 6-phosphate kinase [Melghirimyces profundicolus]
MITVVSLNPAVDKTYSVSRMMEGKVHRVREVQRRPGGKGNNVARVLKLLDCPVRVTGFAGGANGEWIRKQLTALNIPHEYLSVEEETRHCLTILDDENATQTEFLEPGPPVSSSRWLEFKKVLSELASESRFVLFCGSLPPGLPPDAYAEGIRLARKGGARTALDTSGEALRHGMQALPDIVKPNLREFQGITGLAHPDEEDLRAHLKTWNRMGISLAVVTLGARGALATTAGDSLRIHSPSIRAVNTVGSGDAFLAGLVGGLYRDQDLPDVLRLASATAASNARHAQAGDIRPEDVKAWMKAVCITTGKTAD